MEQLGADVMIGPLSGDESIAVANYAKQHPTKTFVNGSAGAQDTTLKVQAPNYYRFSGDGAMWNAGLGDLAYRKLGWKTAAVVADDYSFAWTSAAGFITDFCAAGGAGTAGDVNTPAAKAYNAMMGKWFKTIPPFGAAAPQAASTFTYGFFINAWALVAGLKKVGGDLSGG